LNREVEFEMNNKTERRTRVRAKRPVITWVVRWRLGQLLKVIPITSSASYFILCAAEGMPRGFTMIGYTLDTKPKYQLRNKGKGPAYWYRLGAKLGDYMGAYNLAQCYEVGRGVKRSMKLAAFWWRKAADAGYPEGLTCLAAAYYNGEGVRRNVQKSLLLYALAAKGGDKVAKRMLRQLDWGKQ
jgi:hypothetical protein